MQLGAVVLGPVKTQRPVEFSLRALLKYSAYFGSAVTYAVTYGHILGQTGH